MKQATLDLIHKEKLVVVIRGVEKNRLLPLCEALYEGGIRLAEITFDPTGETSREETADMISEAVRKTEGRLCIGAGTVLNRAYAEAAVKAGAEYIISPNVDIGVIEYCRENDVASLPGAMTPTEIVNAYNAGADVVKVFPSDSLGLFYIKAIRAPLAHIPMITVGGVNENNIADFLKTGVWGVGVGSNIIKKELIEGERYKEITALAKKYVDAVKAYKSL